MRGQQREGLVLLQNNERSVDLNDLGTVRYAGKDAPATSASFPPLFNFPLSSLSSSTVAGDRRPIPYTHRHYWLSVEKCGPPREEGGKLPISIVYTPHPMCHVVFHQIEIRFFPFSPFFSRVMWSQAMHYVICTSEYARETTKGTTVSATNTATWPANTEVSHSTPSSCHAPTTFHQRRSSARTPLLSPISHAVVGIHLRLLRVDRGCARADHRHAAPRYHLRRDRQQGEVIQCDVSYVQQYLFPFSCRRHCRYSKKLASTTQSAMPQTARFRTVLSKTTRRLRVVKNQSFIHVLLGLNICT